jgi:hypothetical protein
MLHGQIRPAQIGYTRFGVPQEAAKSGCIQFMDGGFKECRLEEGRCMRCK